MNYINSVHYRGRISILFLTFSNSFIILKLFSISFTFSFVRIKKIAKYIYWINLLSNILEVYERYSNHLFDRLRAVSRIDANLILNS